ncbi:hypothetical protein G7054_g3643 [Neopestalotiopsis clavispora]|nr:hypothetical protein G7054_g3643 [Neopestalotiopsis clavispora]
MDLYSFPTLPPKWDAIGRFYIAFGATWTFLVLCGMGFLIAHRQMPILRVRGLGLSLTSIAFLHCYWILAQVVYPIGQSVPVILAYDIQYFFMGIWFPLGIALFHASNTRFLYVAEMQKQFTLSHYRRRYVGCNGAHTSWLCRLRNMQYTTRILVYIGLGMIFQVLLTVGMWFACKKYHPTFGIPGTELKGATIPEQLVDLGRGWEWWPSLLWQFIWTWMVAPYLIWKAWGIRDTLGWRTQTIACCLSKIHLSIMFFEIFAVFVPCYIVVRQKIQSRRAAEANTRWENSSQITQSTLVGSVVDPNEWKSMSQLEKGESHATMTTVNNRDSSASDCMLTMQALDRVLSENAVALQEFSALRDFSGENIAFLTRIATWKASWSQLHAAACSDDELREAFTHALAIYTDLISPRDAEFPINLSSQELRDLEAVFEGPARIICGEARINTVLPFETARPTADGRAVSRDSKDTSSGSSSNNADARLDFGDMVDRVRYMGEISDDFNPRIFDQAERHVKYLVLTNTWPKFVHETQRRQSLESERSDATDLSETSIVTRVADKVRSFL